VDEIFFMKKYVKILLEVVEIDVKTFFPLRLL